LSEPVLRAEELRLTLRGRRGGRGLRVVDAVSFEVPAGGFYALIGESGSGKTMIARAVMRLMSARRLAIEGVLRFGGIDLAAATQNEMRRLRGGAMGMIFQDPMSALNPVMTVRRQIEEAARAHPDRRGVEWRDLLTRLGFADPASIGALYPHQLSGGMRQRVMIAMALVNAPALLIADEPTTALDVTIQQQIMQILDGLCRDGLAVFFISHDLALVHRHADRIGVLYGGVLMEDGPAGAVIAAPAHPYTAALLACTPRVREGEARQAGIEGMVPSIDSWFEGCRFAPRCSRRRGDCTQGVIPLVEVAAGRVVRCRYPVT
jgi:peptide/nickel transport system ATP-binding protein